MKTKLLSSLIALASAGAFAATAPGISGDYVEVRSCDVYTGPCFANAEMGLTGKEAILAWFIKQGAWRGTALDGLSVVAVVRTDATLGDQSYRPNGGRAVLIVDTRATTPQREALVAFARAQAGPLIREVVAVKTTSVEMSVGKCAGGSCATVKADGLVQISTRCLGEKDHFCGNESTYYPPLTAVKNAVPAFTELASFAGKGLDVTWEARGQRSAFLAGFAQ